MAIIRSDASRPAILCGHDGFKDDLPEFWKEEVTVAEFHVERAIRATARLESSNERLPYLGTAFAVAPDLAAVPKHVALLIRDLKHPAWLNFFAEHGSEAASRNPVRIRLIHPYFDFALLELKEAVDDANVLTLTTTRPTDHEKLFVIGYPSFDARHSKKLQDEIFGSVFGVKRLMPGLAQGERSPMSFSRPVPALAHDASTLGGTGGAPVVSFATGEVLGMNYAGIADEANFAVPAWLLARDPHIRNAGTRFGDTWPSWMELWGSSDADDGTDEAAAPKIDRPQLGREILNTNRIQALKDILSPDELINLHTYLVAWRFADDSELRTLFSLLPIEFQGTLPNESDASKTLLRRLTYLNGLGTFIASGKNTPLLLVLKMARHMRRIEIDTITALDPFIKHVEDVEARAR